METLNTAFREQIKQAVAYFQSLGTASTTVTEDTVYQQKSEVILPLLDHMVTTLLLPGSCIRGMEHIDDLYDKALSGKSCLLLLEHYSNMDLSIFSYLVRKEFPRGQAMDDALVSIAGIKLNEENPVVSAFTYGYTRIVIYPSRSLQGLDAEKDKAEILRSNAINRAATKTLMKIKNQGKLVLVFPSGTRYRPWDPSTKRGVREIDSYIKLFDYMCPIAVNGEVLHVHQGDMMDDSVSEDLVMLSAGPVLSCKEFRNNVHEEAEAQGNRDAKQAVADAIMELLEDLHQKSELERQKLLGR